uniref:OSJNBb0091E11.15 protein n=1 Tax=Oryza sativa subsp. japonica TaxID=39947 RepID=Q7XU60_ORYSJ|nr:OSJNBb0091E11.15 [Oryza sativa Japonica Group]
MAGCLEHAAHHDTNMSNTAIIPSTELVNYYRFIAQLNPLWHQPRGRDGADKRALPVGDSREAGAPWTKSTHALVRGRTTWQTRGGHDGRVGGGGADVAPRGHPRRAAQGGHVDGPDRLGRPIERSRAGAARQRGRAAVGEQGGGDRPESGGARPDGRRQRAAAALEAAAHTGGGGEGRGAHRDGGDGEAKAGRRPTTRIGGGASRVGVGDGALTTPDRCGGTAEGQQDLGKGMAGLGRHEETPGGVNHRPEERKTEGAHRCAMEVEFRQDSGDRERWPRTSSSLRSRGRRRRGLATTKAAGRRSCSRHTEVVARVDGGGVVTVAI